MASTRVADHIGRVLSGRYRLVSPIGTGASAHVFLAEDTRLGRRVAVKILHPALAGDPSFLRRFEAEARAAAALNHPHILAVYDWGEEGDGPYLVTEYLAGGSLRAMLDRGNRLTPSQALLVGLETVRGLDYAHRRGLVHRDIKPANLIFDGDARLRIADFGLARALAEAAWTEPSGVALGTARYAAPEQARGLAVDGKADVYALALVLVEAVTGRVPFAADTTVATLMSRLERALPVPPEMGPLTAALERAGRLEPEHRADAMAFGTALQAVAPDLPMPDDLPLAGASALDDLLLVAGPDATEIGRARSGAGATGGAGRPPTGSSRNGRNGRNGGGRGLFDAEAAEEAEETAEAEETEEAEPAGTGEDRPKESRRARRKREKAAAEVPFTELLSPAATRRRRWPKVLAVILLVAGIAGGAYAYQQVNVPSHVVPDVGGKPLDTATATLDALNFEIVVERGYHDTAPVDQVVGQEPVFDPEVTYEEGTVVRLSVSDGPSPVPIPDLTDLSDGEAQAALEEGGLVVDAANTVYQHSETVPAHYVIDWSPREGTPLKGSAIALVISDGPAPRIIPSLAGATFDEARAELTNRRLEAARADAFHDDVPEGRVISTNPAPGAQVERGTTVTVTVSKGRPVVPNLNGKTRAEAEAALTAAGLELGAVYGPGGTVFLSSPPAGTRVQSGSTVNVYIG